MKDPDPLLTRPDLARFLALKGPYASGSSSRPRAPRALPRVLRTLGIRLAGGTTRRSVLWAALGLAADQDPAHHDELSEPLLTARTVADLVGAKDPSIVYRWAKGVVPSGFGAFPALIDLSGGRPDARQLRWRRAEVLAWHDRRDAPRYVPLRPDFGSLAPVRRAS